MAMTVTQVPVCELKMHPKITPKLKNKEQVTQSVKPKPKPAAS